MVGYQESRTSLMKSYLIIYHFLRSFKNYARLIKYTVYFRLILLSQSVILINFILIDLTCHEVIQFAMKFD